MGELSTQGERDVAAIDDLIQAAADGDLASVRKTLASDPALAAGSNMFGSTPLHAAHFGGNDEIVALLREKGVALDGFRFAELNLVDDLRAALDADPELATRYNAGGSTALHGAAYWGSLDTARLLLECGADATAQSRDGFLDIHPLGAAVATPDIPNPAHSEDNVLAMAKLLLNRGADVNAQRKDGMTALHTAAYRGHLNAIRFLLDRGADPGIRSHRGGLHSDQTPYDTAVSQRQNEAAALLKMMMR
jgi:ankyrin repeat protein